MAMLLARAHGICAIRRVVSSPSATFLAPVNQNHGNNNRLASTASAPPATGGGAPIKSIPFKAAPVEVKNPEEYTDALPDPIEHATGIEKKQLLALLQGDDRYEGKVYMIRDGSKNDPNLVPSHLPERLIGCVCEPEQHHVVFTWLRKNQLKRCQCGYWFKLVDAEEDMFP